MITTRYISSAEIDAHIYRRAVRGCRCLTCCYHRMDEGRRRRENREWGKGAVAAISAVLVALVLGLVTR